MSAGRKVWLDRRRPCWVCSRSLGWVTTGPNRGKWAAVMIEVDGFERYVHEDCQSGPIAEALAERWWDEVEP